MAAKDHLNSNQLRLFMQAKELMEVPTSEWDNNNNYRTMSEDDDLYYGKLEESDGSENNTFYVAKKGEDTLYKSIQKHGVKTPVRLAHSDGLTHIYNGHHRIAAAYDINPEMYVLVQYHN